MAARSGAARPARDRLRLKRPLLDCRGMTAGIDFSDGLVPCAVQDATSGEVLMLAFVNEEALALTLRTRLRASQV